MFDNGNVSSPRSANLSLFYLCDISLTTVTTSYIEPTVISITNIIKTNGISTPSPSPMNCSTDGIWPETQPGHNITGFYCYKGTVNGK